MKISSWKRYRTPRPRFGWGFRYLEEPRPFSRSRVLNAGWVAIVHSDYATSLRAELARAEATA